MEKQDLNDLRFEMCLIDFTPKFYNDDILLSEMWCKFSNEAFLANELVVTNYSVKDFKTWCERNGLCL